MEFKAAAVRLFRQSGKSLKEVAEDLGVSSSSLWEWVKKRDVAEGSRPGLPSDERAELNKLRRENGILRVPRRSRERKEREIPKKPRSSSWKRPRAGGDVPVRTADLLRWLRPLFPEVLTALRRGETRLEIT